MALSAVANDLLGRDVQDLGQMHQEGLADLHGLPGNH
jgi:hypothetical protein